MAQDYQSLTEKEKQTLRLFLAGHDAKSMARHLGLSVHTINERLRDARRKLCVSSSKEAARLLLRHESAVPKSLVDTSFGGDEPAQVGHQPDQPISGAQAARRVGWAIGGCIMFALAIALLSLSVPAQDTRDHLDAATPVTTSPPAESAATIAARHWLELVDNGRWRDSWAATGQSFRSLNTIAMWQAASEHVRVPLGQVLSRTLVGDEEIPAGRNGARLVRFNTDFANKHGATETVTLYREGGN